jgi:hypothetical protein
MRDHEALIQLSCVLWAITGTLDPVRNLTRLANLNLYSNNIGGMFVLFAFGMMVVVVLECGRL